jgi:hypothetical protein
MKKFYIIYKDDSCIEGETSCSKQQFVDKFINPCIDDIYTYQIWEEEDVVNEPRVIGKIDIDAVPQKQKCICFECKEELDDSCGDPREKIEEYDSIYATEPTGFRLVCKWCIDEQFGEHQPNSIFE